MPSNCQLLLLLLVIAVAVIPTAIGQTVTAVRLVGGTSSRGVLEAQVNGVWGRVCDAGFDNNGASAACAMLGFRPIDGFKISLAAVTTGTTNPVIAVTGCPNFRAASESTWTLTAACTYTSGTSIPTVCNSRNSNTAIICTGTLTTTTALPGPTVTPNLATIAPTNCSNVDGLRLAPGPNEGIVQIRNATGTNFGLVCAAGFGANEAAVICRMLCQGSVNAIGQSGKYLNETTGLNIMLSGLTCPVNATSTNDCTHRGWGVAAAPCASNLAVTVRCDPISLTPPPIPAAQVICFDYKAHVYYSTSEVPSASLLSLRGTYNSSICNFTTGENATTVWAEIPYINCNSVLSSNSTHITYTAQLYKNVTAVGSTFNDVPYIYTVTCSIAKPKETNASFIPEARTAPPIGGGDSYTPEVKVFRQYTAGTFSSEVAVSDRLVVGSRVYARVRLNSPLNVRLTAKQCWISSNPSGSGSRVFILQNKCAANGGSVFRVDNKNIGLNFVVVSFSDITLTQVYIFCDVTICTVEDTSPSCMQVCGTTVRRKRRSVEGDAEVEKRSSKGPFALEMSIAASAAVPQALDATKIQIVAIVTMAVMLMIR